VTPTRPVRAHAPSVNEVIEQFAMISAELEVEHVQARALEVAERIFGAVAGYVVLQETSPKVTHYRGLDRELLKQAAQMPEFRSLIEGEPVRVERPTHPVINLLRPGAVGVSLALAARARPLGRIVLLLPVLAENTKPLLLGFATHVALGIETARLRRATAERSEQLAATVHALPNPVVVVDEGGHFSIVNGAASELFSLTTSFDIGKPVMGRLTPELEELLGRPADGEIELVLGRDPHVYRATSRRVATREKVLGRVLVLDDLTAQADADRMRADFIAVVGHELRTPLTVVRGYAQTLADRWKDLAPEARRQAVDAIASNSRRLEQLIEGVLFVSGMEDSHPHLELTDGDLAGVVAAQADERVAVAVPDHPVLMPIDRAMVDAVLYNLLDNARKYSEGPIELELVEMMETVRISVSDEGEGIYSGDIPHLFERFRQVDSSSTRRHGGMGIGLYITRRLVHAMGGRIWCESRIGVGSKFVFDLPKTPPAHAG
jgi:signal transduction histidine kinase